MKIHTLHFNRIHILFDKEVLPEFSVDLFEPNSLKHQTVNRLGRGAAYLYDFEGIAVVLRHYQRGGLIRFLNRDLYFYYGLENTRMWREFHLLDQLYTQGLPVPRPVAIRCIRHNTFFYGGDLVTQTIAHAQTLAEYLGARELPKVLWHQLGVTIARFHNAKVFHADLNANNILINQQNLFYLIDFDRGELRPESSTGWQKSNLKRLLRSLKKLQKSTPTLKFHEEAWHSLLAGYESKRSN